MLSDSEKVISQNDAKDPSIQERFFVNTGVHKANLSEIKSMMQVGTKEIDTIFQDRVVDMKEIHEDAKRRFMH
ncbi:MAG TPA: hypothetical protein EYO73_01775 [Sulfurimonas sp.]|nr:hypothetical protein [Sulfurimonas sp.]